MFFLDCIRPTPRVDISTFYLRNCQYVSFALCLNLSFTSLPPRLPQARARIPCVILSKTARAGRWARLRRISQAFLLEELHSRQGRLVPAHHNHMQAYLEALQRIPWHQPYHLQKTLASVLTLDSLNSPPICLRVPSRDECYYFGIFVLYDRQTIIKVYFAPIRLRVISGLFADRRILFNCDRRAIHVLP